MSQQHINLGTQSDGKDGDTNRAAWEKTEHNFNDLYGGAMSVQAMKNKLINGKLDIWQAGSTATATSANAIAWGPDRYLGQAYNGSAGTGTSTITLNQQSFAVGQDAVPGNPKFFARLQATAVGPQGGTGSMIRTLQYIEDVSSLSGGTATFSVWLKADSPRNIGFALQQNFGSGGSAAVMAAQTIFAVTTSWQRFTFTFPVPSIAGKTLGDSHNLSLSLYLYKQDNSDSTTFAPLGSWATGIYLDFAMMQLEAGSIATDFDARPFAVEELLCKRYCTTSSSLLIGRWGSATGVRFYNDFEVPMRRAPACSLLTTAFQAEATQVAIYTINGAQITQAIGDNRRFFMDVTGTISGGTPSAGAMAQLNLPQVFLFRAEY
ncbi:carbohydrate binding domain-containing protein [Dyella sp. LX-66]|uniref:carbohydrate binding domain-containing protein n=1 Tax=unclassified Dyella TaxID=2634549 RepID=UPI001BDFD35D|nr:MULTISPECIES: carbohydrate binding domain-containing protein [unclassified Dyella]MBT2116420.1 carbohydrate binding domain-containing protein [Dyella sp. LX-1]MBT2140637.1 carbohydrate binding domain-containing protein [Dyella sp. LX-66]